MTRRQPPPAPTEARALLIQAHPRSGQSGGSFCAALGAAWAEGAREGGLEVDTLVLADLAFDPRYRDDGPQPLEPDLQRAQSLIARARHLTIAFPVWWGGPPALLKGFFDRAFQTGWAYGRDDKGGYIRGLSGRSGRLLVTMDAPGWYDRLFYGRSAIRQTRDATLRFCGVRPTRVSSFVQIENTSPEARQHMLQRARRAGVSDAG